MTTITSFVTIQLLGRMWCTCVVYEKVWRRLWSFRRTSPTTQLLLDLLTWRSIRSLPIIKTTRFDSAKRSYEPAKLCGLEPTYTIIVEWAAEAYFRCFQAARGFEINTEELGSNGPV